MESEAVAGSQGGWVPRSISETQHQLLRRGTGAVGLALVLLVLSSAGAAAMPTADNGPEQEDPVASVGLVRSAGGMGSGWIVAKDTVVTNFHVARAGSGDIYVDFSDGERVECYTAVGDRDMDLALVRCETGDRPALPLDVAIPDPRTPVQVIGYPGGVGPTTTAGEITGERTVIRGIPTIQFTAEIHPGSSGSPVIDDEGFVRGVATFSGGHGVPAENLGRLLDVSQRFPVTKEGAEWRLRIRRAVLVTLIALPIGFVRGRRSGRGGLATMARWVVVAVSLVLVATQAQFAMSGPAHLF